LTIYSEDYKGEDHSFEDGVAFIKELFLNENENPNRKIFHHVTCATQTDNVKVVFEAVKEIIIDQSLVKGGLNL